MQHKSSVESKRVQTSLNAYSMYPSFQTSVNATGKDKLFTELIHNKVHLKKWTWFKWISIITYHSFEAFCRYGF